MASDRARFDVTIDRPLISHLLALRDTGLYGATTEAVLEHLVLQGVRQAVASRLVPHRTFPADLGESAKPSPSPPSRS